MTWLGQIHVESVYRPLCVPVLDPDHNHELGRSVVTFIMDGTKRESAVLLCLHLPRAHAVYLHCWQWPSCAGACT